MLFIREASSAPKKQTNSFFVACDLIVSFGNYFTVFYFVVLRRLIPYGGSVNNNLQISLFYSVIQNANIQPGCDLLILLLRYFVP